MPAPVNPVIEPSSVAGIGAQAPIPAAFPSPPPPAAEAGVAAAAPSPATKEQLQAQLDEALKNSGIKTEIENERSGLVIVRFVQADTGQLILQMPPKGVLDLVAEVEKQLESEQAPFAGQIVDTKV